MGKVAGRQEPSKVRPVAARHESDMDLLMRRAQDAFLPLFIVVLAWIVATSASAL